MHYQKPSYQKKNEYHQQNSYQQNDRYSANGYQKSNYQSDNDYHPQGGYSNQTGYTKKGDSPKKNRYQQQGEYPKKNTHQQQGGYPEKSANNSFQNEKPNLTSVVSYPDRGPWGDSRYRGNVTGHLIKDLLLHFRPTKFVEVFAGGGTGLDVARSLGIMDSLHLDLNPKWGGWNALVDEIPVGMDFCFSHPPYADMIVYSGNMWGEVHPDDLSRCQSYDEFIHKLNLVNAKIYNALLRGGRHAFLVGDQKEKGGPYRSIIKDMAWYGDLENHIIKIQHNEVSSRTHYSGSFIPIKHEHLLIFRKNQVWALPIAHVKKEVRNLLDSRLATWRDLVQAALEYLGGTSKLESIYECLKNSAKAKGNPNWDASIRQTLQRYGEFYSTERGVWNLRINREIRTA